MKLGISDVTLWDNNFWFAAFSQMSNEYYHT